MTPPMPDPGEQKDTAMVEDSSIEQPGSDDRPRDLAPVDLFPMSTIRMARDGRHVLLWVAPEASLPSKCALFNGVVIAHWSWDEREWFLASTDDGMHGSVGLGLIDDDFTAWANLPPLDGSEQAQAQDQQTAGNSRAGSLSPASEQR